MSDNDTPRIMMDDYRVMVQIVVSLTDDIYGHNKFIVLATRIQILKILEFTNILLKMLLSLPLSAAIA
jgi:hypothetical protein